MLLCLNCLPMLLFCVNVDTTNPYFTQSLKQFKLLIFFPMIEFLKLFDHRNVHYKGKMKLVMLFCQEDVNEGGSPKIIEINWTNAIFDRIESIKH